MRGQKSRKGGSVRQGFEGGQTPLFRRLPKVKSHMLGHKKTTYTLIKLNMLNALHDGDDISYQTLFSSGLITKVNKRRHIFKVVGAVSGENLTTQNLTVQAHAFTKSARIAIEAAGGECVVMCPTRNIPLEQAVAEKALRKAEARLALKARRLRKAVYNKENYHPVCNSCI